MKKQFLNILKYLVFLSVGILLLYFAFKEVELKKLMHHLRNANYFWVILSLFLAILSHISRAMRWNLLINPLGYTPKTKTTFYAVMLGYLVNFAFPRLGEVTRCGAVSKKENIPFDTLVGTVIIERAIDLFTLIFITIITILLKIETFGAFVKENIYDRIIRKLVFVENIPVLVYILIALFFFALIFMYFYKKDKIHAAPKVIKIKKLLSGVMSGMKTVFHMKKRRYFLMHTLFIWLMYFLMSYVMFFSFPETSGLTFVDGLFILVIASLAMSLPVQGGIGVFHLFIKLGLEGLYGIDEEIGAAYATLMHESQAVMILLVGGISFFLLFFTGKKKSIHLINHSENKK